MSSSSLPRNTNINRTYDPVLLLKQTRYPKANILGENVMKSTKVKGTKRKLPQLLQQGARKCLLERITTNTNDAISLNLNRTAVML